VGRIRKLTLSTVAFKDVTDLSKLGSMVMIVLLEVQEMICSIIMQGMISYKAVLEMTKYLGEMVMMSFHDVQGQITLILVLEVIKSQTFSQVLIQRQQIVNKQSGLGYIDLYLIHWPVLGMSSETWKGMIQILKGEKVRAIGVSNYMINHLNEILYDSDAVPAVNQVEFHPFLYQQDLLRFCENKRIQLEAYSPLTRAKRLKHPIITKLAQKYDKTPAQVLIRWSLQHGLVVVPKSIHKDRIKQNAQVFDFNLESEDIAIMDSLNENLQTVFLD
jgi:diketogulonate reductase-like aldo/keto reductase